MAHQDRYGLTLSDFLGGKPPPPIARAWTFCLRHGRARRGVRAGDCGGCGFCAGAYCPRPHPHLLPAGRCGAEEGGAGARARGEEWQRAERTHVETLALAIEGQIPAALDSALRHIEAHPRDAIVMSLPMGAFGLFAFSGMADHDQARVDLCGRYAQHYGEDWWYLTITAGR